MLLAEAYYTLEILPQNNATEVFIELNKINILVVLNTGYNVTTAQSLIDKLGWEKGFAHDGLVTATDVKNGRPNPDMIWLAMEQFGITDPNEVVKVGDSIIDIEEGQNAGCILNIGIIPNKIIIRSKFHLNIYSHIHIYSLPLFY